MDALSRARCRADIVTTLSRAGIVAVFDEGSGGFLLMEQGAVKAEEDLWERALRAPVLVLTDEELESSTCVEIAWRKAGFMLRQLPLAEGRGGPDA